MFGAEEYAAIYSREGDYLTAIEDRYRVADSIGQGPLGSVHLAQHVETGQKVALKFVHADLFHSDSEFVRFGWTLRLLAGLTLPNVARIVEAGTCRGAYYVASEYVDGLCLDDYVESKKPDASEVPQLMLTICRAVACGHRRGLVHGHLNPANIRVTDDGKPYILDFGVHFGVLRQLRPDPDAVLGAQKYAAPEQLKGHLADARTDVYSLGVILCRFLTGVFPHEDDGTTGLPPAPPDLLLDRLLRRATTREPAARYQSAVELATDIEKCLAPPDGRTGRFRGPQALPELQLPKEVEVITEDQVAMARSMQQRLIPTDSKLRQLPGVDAALWYAPAMFVGGDYCDLWQARDGRIVFAVGDVCGKGLPAALAMTQLQAALRVTSLLIGSLGDAICRVEQLLSENLPEYMFVTLFVGVLQTTDGLLRYVNAGHIPPIVMSPSGRLHCLAPPRSSVLGIGAGPFTVCEEQLQDEDALVIITDGVTEAASPKGDLFGIEGVKSTLRATGSSQELVDHIVKTVRTFCLSEPQHDDMTVLVLKNAAKRPYRPS